MSTRPSITYREGDTDRTIYTLPPPFNSKTESTLYFTAPKAGTMMLSKLLGELGAHAGLRMIYVIGELFQLGIPPEKAPPSTAGIFLPGGYCYGFPGFPTQFEIPILGVVKTIVLVRDPRDMLVSLYYSALESHPEPGRSQKALKGAVSELAGRETAKSLQIDEFISKIGNYYKPILQNFAKLLSIENVRLFRYEDIIYAKMNWAEDICTHFGWKVHRAIIEKAVSQIDLFPDVERPEQHVRQVHPGNYKNKLKPETIRWIEENYAAEMKAFNYHADMACKGSK